MSFLKSAMHPVSTPSHAGSIGWGGLTLSLFHHCIFTNSEQQECNVHNVYCMHSYHELFEMELQVLCLLIGICSPIVSPFSSCPSGSAVLLHRLSFWIGCPAWICCPSGSAALLDLLPFWIGCPSGSAVLSCMDLLSFWICWTMCITWHNCTKMWKVEINKYLEYTPYLNLDSR